MIKIEGLNKYYFKGKKNELHVLNDIELELPSKSFVTILGESGSGKTTLLNSIAGLDKAKGTITYDDFVSKKYDMKKIDKYRAKNIGYIFQNYNLILNLTVKENLSLALDLVGEYDEREKDDRIDYCLNVVGMLKYKNRIAGALSGGQQQRVSIARALIKDAKYIIADEPTGNLDSENSIEVMNVLRKLSKDMLVLLVTHNRNLAYFYSDRIIEFSDGKIISDNLNEALTSNLVDNKNSTIYLKDYNLISKHDENFDVDFYTDDSIKGIKLKIIVKNGNIYIDSNEIYHSVKEKQITLSDTHQKKVSKEEIESFDFNLPKDNYPKGNKFKSFLSRLKHEFNMFFNGSKKDKKFNFCFGLFSILFAASAFLLATFNSSNTSDEIAPTGSYMVSLGNSDDTISRTEYNALLSSDEITDFGYIYDGDNLKEVQMDLFINGVLYGDTKRYATTLCKLDYVGNILAGDIPSKNNEVLISQGFADLVSSENSYSSLKYESFIGQDLILGGTTFYITGVSSDNLNNLFLNDRMYYAYAHTTTTSSNAFISREYADIGGMTTLLFGSDQDMDSNDILLPARYMTSHVLGGTFISGKTTYDIKGFFESEMTGIAGILEDATLSEVDYGYNNRRGYVFNIIGLSDFEDVGYELLDGRLPQQGVANEVLVSKFSGNEIGDKIYVGGYYGGLYAPEIFEVVGIFDSYICEKGLLVAVDELRVTQSYVADSQDTLYFYTSDLEKTMANFSDYGYEIMSSEEIIVENSILLRQETHTYVIIFSIVLLVIATLFNYLIMRSKMLSNIYEIGVYRALGAKRARIYEKYILNMSMISLFISTIGYLITALIFAILIKVEVFPFTMEIPHLYFLLGYLLMLIIGFISAVLPVISLLRKTPSEILAKYDI